MKKFFLFHKPLSRIFILLILFVFSLNTTHADIDSADVENYQKSVVRLIALGGATGTGFVVSSDGTIATNHHVVAGSEKFNNKIFVLLKSDKKAYMFVADVLASDPNRDVALISIGRVPQLPPALSLSTQKAPAVSENAMALGFPATVDNNSTCNLIFSQIENSLRTSSGRCGEKLFESDSSQILAYATPIFTSGRIAKIQDEIMVSSPIKILFHEAKIDPGSSGGPLLNEKGIVIGINTWGFNRSGRSIYYASSHISELIGFAHEKNIPLSTTTSIAEKVVWTLLGIGAVCFALFLFQKNTHGQTFNTQSNDSGSQKIIIEGTTAQGNSLNFSLPLERIKAAGKYFIIGRSSSCHLSILDDSLSRQHAYFSFRDGALYLGDMDSANGSIVDGIRLKHKEIIKINQASRVKLGQVKFTVKAQ